MKCCDFCGKERKDEKFVTLNGYILADELNVSNRFRECKISTIDMLSSRMTLNWFNKNHEFDNLCAYCLTTAKRFSRENITKTRESCQKFKSKQMLEPNMLKGSHGEHARESYWRESGWGGHNVGCALHFASTDKVEGFNSTMQGLFDANNGYFAHRSDAVKCMYKYTIGLDDVLHEYERQEIVEKEESMNYAYSFVRRKVKVTKLAHDMAMIKFMDNSTSKLKKAMKLREKEAA